jgi:hypothetical protein
LGAILLLACRPGVLGAARSAPTRLFFYLSAEPARDCIQRGQSAADLQSLLGAYIARSGEDGSAAQYAMRLAAAYGLKDTAVEISRRQLAAKDGNLSSLPYALLVLGKFGGRDDLKLLPAALADARQCHTWFRGKDVIRIQVRDVALAVALHLTEQKHADYGQNLIVASPDTLFQIYSCGFETDELRAAGFERWEKWQAEQARGEGQN